MTSICLHGPESTGKSTVGPRLARALGGQYLPEYGRDYAEAHGTDFTMADLVAIGQGHDAMLADAMVEGPRPVVTDTDPLMTAVSCPLLSGPSTMTVWTKEGTTNACEEAQARRDHREAA